MKALIAISVVLFVVISYSARKENKVDKNLHPGSTLMNHSIDKDAKAKDDDDDIGADG
jgi:hypothetical protein